MFSSQSTDYGTPDGLKSELDAEFHFNDDPCPLGMDGLPLMDGLSRSWGTSTFVNPPYGKQIKLWMDKAYRESQMGKVVVMLLPSRTDTQWWHDYAMKASEIRFIKGRLKFGNAKNPAPFPSAIVVFK